MYEEPAEAVRDNASSAANRSINHKAKDLDG